MKDEFEYSSRADRRKALRRAIHKEAHKKIKHDAMMHPKRGSKAG